MGGAGVGCRGQVGPTPPAQPGAAGQYAVLLGAPLRWVALQRTGGLNVIPNSAAGSAATAAAAGAAAANTPVAAARRCIS